MVVEGGEEHFFHRKITPATANSDAVEVEATVELDPTVLHASNRAEDIALVRTHELMFDEDNDPAPESISDSSAPQSDDPNGKWGWGGQCHRKMTGVRNVQSKIKNLNGDILKTVGYIHIFLIFLPRLFIETVVVKLTSDKLSQSLLFGEFFHLLGLWLVITRASLGNLNRRKCWSPSP